LLDYRHVCKTCAFHDALQAGKQKEVHRTPWSGARRRQIRGVRPIKLICLYLLFCVFLYHSPNFLDTPRMIRKRGCARSPVFLFGDCVCLGVLYQVLNSLRKDRHCRR
jgi:hypothetical protein